MSGMDKIKEDVEQAKAEIKKGVDDGAAKLKKNREDGEAKIDEAKAKADKEIDDSDLPKPVKKAAKQATAAGHKAAKEQVEKAREKALDKVDEAEKKANDAIDEAEKKANGIIDDTDKKLKEIVDKATDKLNKVVEDSNLPGPLKDLAKEGIKLLNKEAKGGLDKLKKMAKDGVKDLKKMATDAVKHLKEKAEEVLGKKKDDPIASNSAKPNDETYDRSLDHQGAFKFKVDFGKDFDKDPGLKLGKFTAVDGLTAEIEPIEYQGGMDMYVRQVPGRPKFGSLVLKRGWINTDVIWKWMDDSMRGKPKQADITIILLADDGEKELVRYDCLGTWPSRWSGLQLDAQNSGAIIEELELQVREVKRAKV